MLHPKDEKPKIRKHDKTRSWYQHGGVQMKDGLSIAFVFQNVRVAYAIPFC